MEHGSPTKRSKSKGKAGVDYDASRFTGKNAKNLFNKVWIRNGAVLERKLNLVALENSGISFVQNFTTRGWINLAKFKAESVLTLCQEFMANIKHEPETEQGKEKLCSWVRGKKIKCNKTRLKDKYLILFLFSCHSLLPLKRTVSMNTARARLLWAIGTGKTIFLPRIMFLSLCSTYKASDKRGSVPFTGFLTELFKRSGVHIPVDFIRIEPEGPIDRASLSRSEGQRKKRKLEEEAQEGSAIGMGDLKEAILNLGKRIDSEAPTAKFYPSRSTSKSAGGRGGLYLSRSSVRPPASSKKNSSRRTNPPSSMQSPTSKTRPTTILGTTWLLAVDDDEKTSVAFLDSLLLGEWEDRVQRGLFHYDVIACETKVIPGEYGFIAQLNEGRHLKKRPTEFRVDKVLQPFDGSKFNFTKVGQEEVLFQFFPNAQEGVHTRLVC
ncbi:GDP-L-galactose phosphorylase 1 [Actinidia rufa]|uniref:GDP-L-galactose phosphorylase 1 n=1 Tax=Actinidia rufa TaxID=165716 RepID=A0A7J0DJD5_9ERIC|nr:GDP-L-galactose phosphorylase 1 [Actinidia rufa]